MATKKGGGGSGGDSKQGLIIALVCFVLLSIGLGVFAYYGNTDKETLITNDPRLVPVPGIARTGVSGPP